MRLGNSASKLVLWITQGYLIGNRGKKMASSWYPEGSMKGSGIDSVDITKEVECECGHAWEMDFSTDDWGNVEQEVKCPSCEREFTFTYEKGDDYWEDVDAAYEAWAEK